MAQVSLNNVVKVFDGGIIAVNNATPIPHPRLAFVFFMEEFLIHHPGFLQIYSFICPIGINCA